MGHKMAKSLFNGKRKKEEKANPFCSHPKSTLAIELLKEHYLLSSSDKALLIITQH